MQLFDTQEQTVSIYTHNKYTISTVTMRDTEEVTALVYDEEATLLAVFTFTIVHERLNFTVEYGGDVFVEDIALLLCDYIIHEE